MTASSDATATRLRRARTAAFAAFAAVCLALLAGAVGGDGHAATDGNHAAARARPNVVVMQTDDQDLRSLRVMDRTLRTVGGGGTTFDRYFVTHPRCCPSRATYLTGQYSHNHGVEANNFLDGGGFRSLDNSETLPVWLERAGYTTAHLGKYLNGYGFDDPIPSGWTEWYGSPAGSTERMFAYDLIENEDVGQAPTRTVHYGDTRRDYKTDVLARKAVDFIQRQAGLSAPFFLSINPLAPHVENIEYTGTNPRPAPRHEGTFADEPLPEPPSFNEQDVSDKPSFIRDNHRFAEKQRLRTERRYRSRLESLLAVDEAMQSIVRALRDTRVLDRTLIIFTSDNGYFHGEHRLSSGKEKLYEEAVNVPLLIRGPGFPSGVGRRQIAANVDLAPTILDVTGAEARGHPLDGRSLLPLAQDQQVGQGRELLLENGISGSTGIRTERYVYLEHETGEEELYDLYADPFQLESLHDDAALDSVLARLRQSLAELELCEGRECY